MRRPYQILLPLLSLFLVRVDLTDLSPLVLNVRLVRLLDGDTAEVKYRGQSLTVRFSGVDAPELGQPFLSGEGDAGEKSAQCTREIFDKQKDLKLRIFGQDIYGRILGDISGLNLKLVRKGCSSLYPYASFASRREKWKFIHALNQAKKQKLGIWKSGGFQSPKLWRKKSKKTSKRNAGQR